MPNNIKKVALFSPNLNGGGAERVISILAAHFAGMGFQVDLILGEKKGPYLINIPKGVNVISLDNKRVMYCLPKLVTYLNGNKPDVIISSQMHSSTVVLLASKLAKVTPQVIIRQPTMLNPTYKRKTFSSRLRQSFFLWAAKSWASNIVVTSQAMAEEFVNLCNIPKERLTVIYNPIPINEVKAKSKKNIIHPWLNAEQQNIVLAVGRLVKVKDFETLIRAFHLTKKQVDARLIILGEGPLRKELEGLIFDLNLSEYVEIAGFAENPFAYMRQSKVFVLSSLWEGFPNSMIEAMVCGCNIVATKCQGGTEEILDSGKWGDLVPVQSPKKMSEAIIKALEKKDNQNEKVISQLDVNVILNKFASLIK